MQQQRSNKSKRNRTKERICDRSILSTLHYRSVFNSALSFYQLGTFLLSDRTVDYSTYKRRLRALQQNRKINQHRGRYFLTGTKPLSWHSRAEISLDHISSVEETIRALSKIKWIKLLAITGSVAAHNASKDDDIDIFIITERHRLWITRLFVVLMLKALDMYRTEKNSVGKICPNIFIDDSAMEWPKDKQNVYVAHEILMMHPIVNRDDTYFKFIKKNEWVFKYMPNFFMQLPSDIKVAPPYQSSLLKLADWLSMHLQQAYMYRKKTTEVTQMSFIHFNKADHSIKVLERFDEFTSSR